MTPAEVATKLRAFNDWRRGGDIEYPGPLAVDEAIDAAVEMIDRLEAAEKERDFAKVEIARLHDDIHELTDERDALRAKIEQMERQEPVATARLNAINGNPSVDFVPGHRYLHHNDKLCLAPGAKGETK